MQFSLGSREYGGLILDLDILVVQILIHSNVWDVMKKENGS
jgi:hypothetical protein